MGSFGGPVSWWELALVALVALPLAVLLQDWRSTVGWLVFHAVALSVQAAALFFVFGLHLFSLCLSLVTLAGAFWRGLRHGWRRRWSGN